MQVYTNASCCMSNFHRPHPQGGNRVWSSGPDRSGVRKVLSLELSSGSQAQHGEQLPTQPQEPGPGPWTAGLAGQTAAGLSASTVVWRQRSPYDELLLEPTVAQAPWECVSLFSAERQALLPLPCNSVPFCPFILIPFLLATLILTFP